MKTNNQSICLQGGVTAGIRAGVGGRGGRGFGHLLSFETLKMSPVTLKCSTGMRRMYEVNMVSIT